MTFDDDPLPKIESFAKKDLKKWITKLKKKLTLEDQPADSEKIEIIPKFGFNRYVRTTMFIKEINEELARREALDKTHKTGKRGAKLKKDVPVEESAKPVNIILPTLEDLPPIQIEQDEEPIPVEQFRTSEISRVTTRSTMKKLVEVPMSPLTSRNSDTKSIEPIFFDISFTTNQETRTIESFKINGMATFSMMKKEKEASTSPSFPQIPQKVPPIHTPKEIVKIGEPMPTSSSRTSPGASEIRDSEWKTAQKPSIKLVETPESCRVATLFSSPPICQIPQIDSSFCTPEKNVRTGESMPMSLKRNSHGPSGTRNSDTKSIEPIFFGISFTTNQESRTIEAFKINRMVTLSMMKKIKEASTSPSTLQILQKVPPIGSPKEIVKIGESMPMSLKMKYPGRSGIRNTESGSVEEPSIAKLSETMENCRVTTRSMMKRKEQTFTPSSTSLGHPGSTYTQIDTVRTGRSRNPKK